MYEEFVANRIKQLRKQKNISAREMSLAIGQNVNYINRIERNYNLPSLQGLFYICEYFDITPQEFFDCNSNSNPMVLQEAMRELANLDNENLKLVISLAKALQGKK